MALSFEFQKPALRLKLKDLGLSDTQLEEMMSLFDQKNRRLDIIAFAMGVERFGVPREKVYAFMKSLGADDPTLISVFSRVDLKKAGLDDSKMQEVVVSG